MSCCEDQVNIGIGDKRDIQEWMTGTTYQEREEVDHASSVYICLVCHVSTDFATDLGAGYWLLIGGAAAVNTWAGVLAAGNVSGGTTPIISAGDQLHFANGAFFGRMASGTLSANRNYTLPDASGVFLVGPGWDSLVTSPTITEDGYVIKWDNATGTYKLLPDAAGTTNIYTSNGTIAANRIVDLNNAGSATLSFTLAGGNSILTMTESGILVLGSGASNLAGDASATVHGFAALVQAIETTAMGAGSDAPLIGSRAYGYGAVANGQYSLAVGHTSVTGATSATAIGRNANASGTQSLSVGFGAATNGPNNIVLSAGGGTNVTATGATQSIAIGSYSTTVNSRTNAIAIGVTAVINGDSGIGIGNDTTAGFRSTVVGGFATANVTRGAAFGELAAVAGTGGVAVGSQTDAGGEAIAVGYIAQATFDYSIAIGSGANGGGVYATATGYTASAGAFGTVYGAFAATVANGTAIGRNANAADGVALGWYANCQSGAGIAIGEQSATEAGRFYNINIHAGAGGNDKSILHLYNLVGGAGYVDGTYLAVSLTGGSGAGAKADIVVSGGAVISCTRTYLQYGSNYVPGDVLSANAADLGGAGAGFSITVMLSAGVFGGNTSVGIGSGQTTAYGFAAVAVGHNAGASGNGTAVGVSAIANNYANAFGNDTQAEGAGSTAIGVSYVRAKATNSIAMGLGFFSGSPFYMENTVANSFGVGFAKTSPQILLAPADDSYFNTTKKLLLGDGSADGSGGAPNNTPANYEKLTVFGNVEAAHPSGTGNVYGFVARADDGTRVLMKLVSAGGGNYAWDTGTVLP